MKKQRGNKTAIHLFQRSTQCLDQKTWDFT